MDKCQVSSVIELRKNLFFKLFYCIWLTLHYVVNEYLYHWIWCYFFCLFFYLFHFFFFCLWSVHTLSTLLPVILMIALFHQPFPFFLSSPLAIMHLLHAWIFLGCSWRADHIFAPWIESFVAALLKIWLQMVCGLYPVALVFHICTDGSVHKPTVSPGLLLLLLHINLVYPFSLWVHVRVVVTRLHVAAQSCLACVAGNFCE